MTPSLGRSTLLLTLVSACGAGDARHALERYATETLVPGRGAGAIVVGVSTLGEVQALFGDTNAFEHRDASSVHHYANGLSIVTEPGRDSRGVIRAVRAKQENIFGGKGFAGRTDKGIAIGDSREQVLATYGEPVDFGEMKSILHYASGVTFSLRRDRVVEIVILKPKE